MKIPQILLQTSPQKHPLYVIEILNKRSPNWKYYHFDDNEIIRYLINHPEPEFPFIINKFHEMRFGAHKADLFRYYFLYQNGGVFLDSDAMIECSIDNIVKDYELFSVKSYIENTVFQGFIGCIPRHPILYMALKDVYTINVVRLTNDYHLLTRNMFEFFNENENHKLYQELESDGEKAITIDDEGSLILTHYWKNKTIPQ
uniref:Glycosyltransferase n=1 Tax=viral metagenome TaxID=1070528 RepID=A0A6C0B8W4_9ZZZZ